MSRSNEARDEFLNSCRSLGITAEKITRDEVFTAWKKNLIVPPSLAPPENDEHIILLNQAKDFLINWIERESTET